jgi:hypothetical protein
MKDILTDRIVALGALRVVVCRYHASLVDAWIAYYREDHGTIAQDVALERASLLRAVHDELVTHLALHASSDARTFPDRMSRLEHDIGRDLASAAGQRWLPLVIADIRARLAGYMDRPIPEVPADDAIAEPETRRDTDAMALGVAAALTQEDEEEALP